MYNEAAECAEGKPYYPKPLPIEGFDVSINKTPEDPNACSIDVKAPDSEPKNDTPKDSLAPNWRNSKWKALAGAVATAAITRYL